ncbi:MAG TPA: c-type cytochrome, partial [Candidatus Limnocylindria bacterium]|nr:c-type cytochrome [Candidatus Limnocylindria bacterium]
MKRPFKIVLLVLAVLLVTLAYVGRHAWEGAPAPPPIVVVPELSSAAREGRNAFDRRCVQCHGRHAAGTAVGPPLVHSIYRPAHHADVAFALAVQRGV